MINNEFKKILINQYKHLKIDTTPVDIEIMAVPFRYKNENGALVFVRDITEF